MIHSEAQIFPTHIPLKLEKVFVAKIQLWGRHSVFVDIPIPKGRNERKKGFINSKKFQDQSEHIPLGFKAWK